MSENTITVTFKLSGTSDKFAHNISGSDTIDKVFEGVSQVNPEVTKDTYSLVRRGRILKLDQVIE
jgi:hypothetical protein